MIKRLAVMLHHGLGDVICALPALWAVDRQLGRAGRFHIVVKSELEADVIRAIDWHGDVQLSYLPPGHGWRRWARSVLTLLTLRLKRPDAFLAVHVASPSVAALFSRIIGAPRAIIPVAQPSTRADAIARGAHDHKAQYYARFFQAAGFDLDLDLLQFPPVVGEGGIGAREVRVALAPAVGAALEQHKRWPERRFSDLATAIVDCWPEARVVLFASPKDGAILKRISDGIPLEKRSRVELAMPATPALAVQSLMGLRCLVTPCSGASHLAAWAGIPIVGLYGPTNPSFTGPLSPRLHVVRKDYVCSPCYRASYLSGCGDPVCMTDITVSDVLPAIAAAISGQSPLPRQFVPDAPFNALHPSD